MEGQEADREVEAGVPSNTALLGVQLVAGRRWSIDGDLDALCAALND